MASFRQHGNGWQGRIRRRGYPDITKTFETKVDAEKWARALESEIDKGQFVNVSEAQRTTLGAVIERYLAEVTPSMKGAAEDTIRLKAMMRRSIARWSMANLSAARIAAYRDERLKEVSAGTVIRELAYLSAIINHVPYVKAGRRVVYAITAPPSLLTARRQDDTGPRNDLAALAGARYVSINEMQAGDRLDEQVVKMLAGREPISARFLHQEFFEFTPSFTPWLRTNHKPIITGLDDGIWRRLVLLPFSRKFADDEKDPALEQKLLEEQDAILMWMVKGAQLYLQDGIRLSPRMRSELGTYRTESDLLGEFLADQTTQDSTGKVPQSLLYSSYRSWCEDCGVRPLSKKTFTQRLDERGFPEGKSGKHRFYTGLIWGAQITPSTQDGVDGMEGISGISLYGNLSGDKTPNSLPSRPTCPQSTVQRLES